MSAPSRAHLATNVLAEDFIAPKIVIDEEFKFLLPRLDEESSAALEASVLEHGIRDALVLWKGHDILIDGHNRYGFAMKHGLPFKTVELEFPTREDVIVWIITTQIARRNLSPLQFTYFLGLQYGAAKKIRGGQRAGAGRKKIEASADADVIVGSKESNVQNEHLINSEAGSTASIVGGQHGLAKSTVVRAEKVADGITAIGKTSKEAKRKIIDGEVRISRKRLSELGAKPNREVATIARSIEDGSFKSGGSLPDPSTTGSADALPSKSDATRKFERELFAANASFGAALKAASNLPALKRATSKHIAQLQSLLG
ncbi:MAG: hypothetical protein FWE46_01150 [Coriobacteriia bacterium]|nr:hypothetical protein [Coriobacteriia bacterium]MCL2537458.1 hypothetical protein [Coriobacteriia bacterium]